MVEEKEFLHGMKEYFRTQTRISWSDFIYFISFSVTGIIVCIVCLLLSIISQDVRKLWPIWIVGLVFSLLFFYVSHIGYRIMVEREHVK